MKEKIKTFLQQIYWKILIICFAIYFSWQDSDPFWIVLLILGFGIYFIATKPIPEKIHRIIVIIVWISVLLVGGLIFYVNRHYPHGPMYSTGEYVCQNDDRGPCREEYKEDMRGLNIPDWAKFLRKSEGMLLWIGLLFAGIVISSKKDEGET